MARLLQVLALLGGIGVLFLIADAQRMFFGDAIGNTVLWFEVIAAGFLIFAARFFFCGDKWHLRYASLLAGLAVSLGILGWLSDPELPLRSAQQRVQEAERWINDYQEDLITARGDTADQMLQYTQRAETELAARRLELQARKVRYAGDPEYFRSSFLSYYMYAYAALLSILALAYARRGLRGNGSS